MPITTPAPICSTVVLYPGRAQAYVPHGATGDWSPRGEHLKPVAVNAPAMDARVPDDDDSSLVSGMAHGDEHAATTLYDRHGAVMYGLAIRMLGEPADAEEVVLDAFAQAWREAGRFDGSRGSVLGWLTTIVRSRALDAIRARGRRAKMVEKAGASSDEPVAMSQALPAPDQEVDASDRAVAVGAALRTLPDPQRRAIELAFFEGLTHQEVAERLREPLGTVKTRIRLGMLKLRDMLDGLAPEPTP